MKSIDLSEFKYLYNSGMNKPVSDERFCCFGVFDEGDFIFNSRPDNMDDAFIVEKIKEGTLGPKSSEIVKDLKEKHNGQSIFIVVDHDLKEAVFFKSGNGEEAKKALFTSHEISDELRYNEKAFVSRNLNEFISLAFSTKKNFSDKPFDLINVRRDVAKFFPIKEYKLDKIALSSKITDKDIAFMVAHHELGHAVDKNNPYRSEYDRTRPSMYEGHRQETFADIYASLLSIKERGDTKMVSFWADYRACDTERNIGIESVSSYGRGDQFSVKNAESVSFYNTAPALYKVASFADEKLNKDKDFFTNLSFEQIEAMSKDLTFSFTLSDNELDGMKDEILDFKDGNEKQKSKRRQIEIFKRNGYSFSENYEAFEQIKTQDKEYLSSPALSPAREKQINDHATKQVSKDLLDLILKEQKKGSNYYTSFLEASSKLKRKITEEINPLYSEEAERKLKALSKIGENHKDDFKPAFAFNDFLEKTKIPKEYQNLGKKASFAAYIETKKNFLKGLRSVNSDILENNVTVKTKNDFKNVLRNAKYCHFLAEKAMKSEIENPSLTEFIKSDKKHSYPKILNDFFLNSTSSSSAINLLVKDGLSLLEPVAIKNQRSSQR